MIHRPHRTLALGRMKSGAMNRTEAAYGQHLEARKIAGEVLWYAFEIATFKLADDLRFTGDYMVLLASGQLEIHEIKGTTTKKLKSGPAKAPYFHGDAKTKVRMAAELVPMAFKVCYLVAGNWIEEEV